MSDPTEFLLARIAEDEAVAGTAFALFSDFTMEGQSAARFGSFIRRFDPHRVLTECAAKRLVVADLGGAEFALDCHPEDEGERAHVAGLRKAALRIAAVYADHPDFRQEWRP